MKRFSLIAVSLIFAAFLAVAANAQTTPTGDKVGLVAWGAFEDPAKGIKKYSAALTALDKEFEPVYAELRTMATNFENLRKEIATLQEQASKGGTSVPVNTATIQTKIDQLGQMERDIKKKQEDAKAKYQSRYNTVIGPIAGDILKAMSEYATQKGYAVILDGEKLEQSGILLGFAAKANVTDDFIAFYNARPATTATK